MRCTIVRFLLATALALVAAGGGRSEAGTIARINFPPPGGGENGGRAIWTGLEIYLVYDSGLANGNPNLQNPVFVFQGQQFSPSDVGKTFSATAATDPGFNAFAALLTDGISETFFIYVEVGGLGEAESGWFATAGLPAPDLAGYRLTSIDLTITQLTLNSPGSNPNGDGIWTDYQAAGTFSFEGVPASVPAPPSFVLAVTATCAGLGHALGSRWPKRTGRGK